MSHYITHPSNLCGCGCKGSGACGPNGMGHDGLSGTIQGIGKGYIVLGLAALVVFLYSKRRASR